MTITFAEFVNMTTKEWASLDEYIGWDRNKAEVVRLENGVTKRKWLPGDTAWLHYELETSIFTTCIPHNYVVWLIDYYAMLDLTLQEDSDPK